MTAALTPDAALALVSTLTPGLRRAAVLDAGGAWLAGDRDLAARAHRELDAAGPGVAVRTRDGLHAARDDRHAVAAEAGQDVLDGLLLADLHAALAALRAG
jgi:hypothetical protein